MTLKICHLTSVHSQTDARIYLKQCITLSKNGYSVHLVAPNASKIEKSPVEIHSISRKSKKRLIRMTTSVYNVYKEALRIDAEIYHFHDPELIPVGLMLKKKNKKVIYDVHEDVPKQILRKHWIPLSLRVIVSKMFEKLEYFSAQKFDLIVGATPHIRDRFIKYNKNSIDIKNYPLLKELHIENQDWEKKSNEVCYIGGISAQRGIFKMLEALNYQKNVRLNLAGKFSDNSEKILAEEKAEWMQVNYLGYLNRNEVKRIYENSFAGLVVLQPLKSYKESLPVKMFEYMAAGIPVISSDFPLWNNIIERNSCGISVNQDNPEEIAQAITRLYENPELAKNLGANGRRAVETLYNWENESLALLDAYKNLISKKEGL